MKKLEWHTEKRKISELKPWGRNPRKATEKQEKDLEASLDRFSLADPLIINPNGTVIGGHFRLRILKKRGIEEADVRVPNRPLTEKEIEELNIRLNKNLGEWDFDLLANFDEKLLENIGWESPELDEIFQLDTTPEDDEVPEIRKTNIKLGDIFQLGNHRLLCGDATKREDVEKLMQGEKADMVFTDPPYGVTKEKWDREL